MITALFLISLALYANFNVEIVSLIDTTLGVMLAIISVLLFPPKLSLSRKVNLLSR